MVTFPRISNPVDGLATGKTIWIGSTEFRGPGGGIGQQTYLRPEDHLEFKAATP